MKIYRKIFHLDATIDTYLDLTFTTCLSDCSKTCKGTRLQFLQEHIIGFNSDTDVEVFTTGFYSDTTVHVIFTIRSMQETEKDKGTYTFARILSQSYRTYCFIHLFIIFVVSIA